MMYRALLAEHDALVAMDLAYELEARGIEIAGITSSLEGALKLIEEKSLDLAIMTVELQDGLSYPAARRLRALGIPFAFFTSFGKDEIDAEFSDVPYLSKPQDSVTFAAFVEIFVKSLPQGPAAAPKRRDEFISAKG